MLDFSPSPLFAVKTSAPGGLVADLVFQHRRGKGEDARGSYTERYSGNMRRRGYSMRCQCSDTCEAGEEGYRCVEYCRLRIISLINIVLSYCVRSHCRESLPNNCSRAQWSYAVFGVRGCPQGLSLLVTKSATGRD